jgi:hypothetical protein
VRISANVTSDFRNVTDSMGLGVGVVVRIALELAVMAYKAACAARQRYLAVFAQSWIRKSLNYRRFSERSAYKIWHDSNDFPLSASHVWSKQELYELVRAIQR